MRKSSKQSKPPVFRTRNWPVIIKCCKIRPNILRQCRTVPGPYLLQKPHRRSSGYNGIAKTAARFRIRFSLCRPDCRSTQIQKNIVSASATIDYLQIREYIIRKLHRYPYSFNIYQETENTQMSPKNRILPQAHSDRAWLSFAMGFIDLVGIATNYVKADFSLSDSVANLFSSMVFFWF